MPGYRKETAAAEGSFSGSNYPVVDAAFLEETFYMTRTSFWSLETAFKPYISSPPKPLVLCRVGPPRK